MKIFVIGGHKNGTKSIHEWFIKRGLKSCHGDHWYRNQHIIKTFDCFSDHFAEFGFIDSVKKLDKKYPNSLFILNYRTLPSYINSLLKHLLWGNVKERKWKWNTPGRATFSQRIINTHNTNQYAINYFRLKKNQQLLVINLCNGENENNTKILENFIGLKHNPEILLDHKTHNIPSLDEPDMKNEYIKNINKINTETDIIYKHISDKDYIDRLDLASELCKKLYLK